MAILRSKVGRQVESVGGAVQDAVTISLTVENLA
jgi:hypothetical protein